ncbi:MnhB domain-containing protein [Clostridiisalibacter paucivorans]|uniref:MnhB domain-containing protein n=1 Tax=Clostridiisalibacter paucivorans TaxID=408753 RepID=UPI000687B284|nr:MnhB domain-containing protein [Clostridiisalibacter paucivorans]
MNTVILKEVTKLVIPFIQVFGIYVIFHGHLSPGGGFAGGTIIGASLILYRLVMGSEKASKKFSYNRLIKILSFALIIYGILKGFSFITGGSHIEGFSMPLGNAGNILSGGYLLPLNICVGAIVSVTVYFFFSLFYEGHI